MITDAKGASGADDLEQLKAQEARLRAIVESAPACLARVGRDATILAMNNAGRSMLGAARGRDVLKQSLLSFVAADDQERARQLIDGACSGQAASAELTLNGLGGATRRVEVSAVSLPARGDAAATALMTFRDVTGRRRLEQSVEVDLERRLNESEERSRGLEAERDALAARANAAAAEAHALSDRVRALEVTDHGLEQECHELRREVDDRRREVEAGQRALAAARLELDAGRRELEEARLALAARQRELDAHAREIEHGRQERGTLQRLLDEERERAQSAPPAAAEPESQLRLSSIEAECGRLAAERDELLSSASRARAEMRALDERLHAHDTTHTAIVSERDELKRALAAARTEHATEMAAAFADRAALERRVHDRDALMAAVESAQQARDRAVADRDAALRSLEELQQYEKAARRWITQWLELEQALHTARSEFQHLAEWARERNERMSPVTIAAADGSGR